MKELKVSVMLKIEVFYGVHVCVCGESVLKN